MNLENSRWYRDAACRGSDPNLFTYNETIPKNIVEGNPSNEGNFLLAETICATCPVITECWQDANDLDKTFTMRGGAWPTQYERPSAGRPVKKICKRGHDTSTPGARDAKNECILCKRERDADRRAARREAREAKSAAVVD